MYVLYSSWVHLSTNNFINLRKNHLQVLGMGNDDTAISLRIEHRTHIGRATEHADVTAAQVPVAVAGVHCNANLEPLVRDLSACLLVIFQWHAIEHVNRRPRRVDCAVHSSAIFATRAANCSRVNGLNFCTAARA